MEEVLQAAGIKSFAELAAKTGEDIKAILDASESRVHHLDPATWPKQAQLAAEGQWDELKTLQDELNAGRE